MAENTVKKSTLSGFFKSLKAEFKKISWPTKDQLFKQTLAVVIISAVLCLFISLFDWLAQLLIGFVGQIF